MQNQFTEERYKPFVVYINGLLDIRFESFTVADEFTRGFNKGMRSHDMEMPENKNNMTPFNRGYLFADKFKFFCVHHAIEWQSPTGYIRILASTR